MRIRNLPEYAFAYKYVAYREVGGEYWFYGAYNDAEKAAWVADVIGGEFVMTEAIEHDTV